MTPEISEAASTTDYHYAWRVCIHRLRLFIAFAFQTLYAITPSQPMPAVTPHMQPRSQPSTRQPPEPPAPRQRRSPPCLDEYSRHVFLLFSLFSLLHIFFLLFLLSIATPRMTASSFLHSLLHDRFFYSDRISSKFRHFRLLFITVEDLIDIRDISHYR